MSAKPIHLSFPLPVPAKRAWGAFLSSKEHTAFLGAKSVFPAKVGGKWTAWEGYCGGRILERLTRRVTLTWRASDWDAKHPDSLVVFEFLDVPSGCEVRITQLGAPDDQRASLAKGWKDFYAQPMKAYFKNEG